MGQQHFKARLGLSTKEKELKLGTSFTNPKECAFHTLRYDFKPASVDTNKMATIDVGNNSEISVSFPPNLLFKGSSKPYQKQGIVIVDLETGEVTLEKLTCNISVKQIRSENKTLNAHKLSMIEQLVSGQKSKKTVMNKSSKGNSSSNNSGNTDNGKSSKQNSKTKVESQSQSHQKNLLPIHSVSARNSPNSARFQSGLSPCNASPSKATLDDQAALDDWLNSLDSSRSNSAKHEMKKLPPKEEVKLSTRLDDEVGELSDSSSSGGSSSSGDSSSESSDSESRPKKKVCQNGRMKGSPDPEALLKEDLRLSESGSDSD